jgi:hypothetical protein
MGWCDAFPFASTRTPAIFMPEEIVDPPFSISRLTKLKSVSRYCTQYSSVGNDPASLICDLTSVKPRSLKTSWMIAGFLVLKYPAVGGAREEPQPGTQRQAIAEVFTLAWPGRLGVTRMPLNTRSGPLVLILTVHACPMTLSKSMLGLRLTASTLYLNSSLSPSLPSK